MATVVEQQNDVLAFWFKELTQEDWFRSDPGLDAAVTARFRDLHLALAHGVGEEWRSSAMARLAAIVVLDQFPRNIYRGTPLAFATDGLARREAELAIEAGADLQVEEAIRCFFYLPFEHSEDLVDQNRAVVLFETLGHALYLDYAERHRQVIVDFGRFPHRNAFLGRVSTEAEKLYLSQPGAGF